MTGKYKKSEPRQKAEDVIKHLTELREKSEGEQREALNIALNYVSANEDDLDDCIAFEEDEE